ncbi:MAG: adenosylcobalamin-dependent ribonucleoside-diphosphate reductase [Candidatus Omnitrophica bacterium]|nr:adenosylcobalamin-dependent ribonucleoside-diphosphate reductase [Candidatus Omnitrophota bacterium]
MKILYVRKRDGKIEEFSDQKITLAIQKGLKANKKDTPGLAKKLCSQVVKVLEKEKNKCPSVEHIQDVVEEILMKNNLPDVARSYILYREKRKQLRESKKIIGVEDRLKLSLSAISILRKRYLLRDETGKITETPQQMFERVAKYVADAEKSLSERNRYHEKFYAMLSSLEFLPNSPTLMNAGTVLGQLSACFVLPVPDSIEGIFEALKNMAIIHQSGGGTGFSFSSIRPKGDIVRSTMGVASGPVSFIEIFDKATDIVKQGGRRRGANMGIMRVDHPDIIDFVASKRNNELSNFNISVAITDLFMESVIKNRNFELINPRTKKTTRKIPARELFDIICQAAWETGDPGLVFIDEINRKNPTPGLGSIESTNPCGEQPLLNYESCNLGSINLTKVIDKKNINWNKLGEIVKLSVRFLDDVIDVNRYFLPEIEKMTLGNRKIGLGVMGWADLLAELEIPYGSKKSLELAEKIMEFINRTAFEYSAHLGKEKGSFPNFEKSVYRKNVNHLRNCTRTTIAPTGTISIIAGCSSGIEPFFAIAYGKKMAGSSIFEINPVWERKVSELKLRDSELIAEIVRTGSVQNIKGMPEKIKKVFRIAFEIKPDLHLLMQASFQKHTDNAVSKTINLPEEATIGDVKKIFVSAYRLKCKGITVFRYGSKSAQVLYLGEDFSDEIDYIQLGENFSGCSKGYCNY